MDRVTVGGRRLGDAMGAHPIEIGGGPGQARREPVEGESGGERHDDSEFEHGNPPSTFLEVVAPICERHVPPAFLDGLSMLAYFQAGPPQ